MNNKVIFGVLIIIVVVLVVWFLGRNDVLPETSPLAASLDEAPADMSQNPGSLKEFTVVGSNFKFSLDTITVQKGDTVRIRFQNGGGVHNWTLDEFDARTAIIKEAGQEDTIEFIADTAGTFEYYCSLGNHRAMGMVGSFIVEDR